MKGDVASSLLLILVGVAIVARTVRGTLVTRIRTLSGGS